MEPRPRFHFIVDGADQVIVIRAIGEIAPTAFVDQVFQRLSETPEPWGYNRLFDVRRWAHRLSADTVRALAVRWTELTNGQIYHARLAVVTYDHGTLYRTPAPSEYFPEETVCYFDDFHEASGWLRATNPARYLTGLAEKPANHQTYGGIIIE